MFNMCSGLFRPSPAPTRQVVVRHVEVLQRGQGPKGLGRQPAVHMKTRFTELHVCACWLPGLAGSVWPDLAGSGRIPGFCNTHVPVK